MNHLIPSIMTLLLIPCICMAEPLVVLSGSGLIIENQVYETYGEPALVLAGTASHVTLRNCRFVAHPGTSGQVFECAKISAPFVSLIDCELEGGTSHGLYLFAFGNRIPHDFLMRGSSIHGAVKWGLHMNNEGNGLHPDRVHFEDVSIWGCGAGAVIAMGRNPNFERVSIDGNGNVGLWAGYQLSTGILLDSCVISGSSTGIVIGPEARGLRALGTVFNDNSCDMRTK